MSDVVMHLSKEGMRRRRPELSESALDTAFLLAVYGIDRY